LPPLLHEWFQWELLRDNWCTRLHQNRDDLEDAIQKVARMLIESRYAVAFTGAGMSVESGIPDFRGPQGLWKTYNPEVATLSFFSKNPEQFWKFAREIGDKLLKAKPNPAHKALAKLEKMGYIKAVITQNIDGLHQKAGSVNVIEIHGNIEKFICMFCKVVYDIEYVRKKLKNDAFPYCELCGGPLKPMATFFEEKPPEDAIERAAEEAKKCDLMLILGSSLVVEPAAQIPRIAKRNGAKLVIINMEPTWFDNACDIVIHERVGLVLPKVVKYVIRMTKKSRLSKLLDFFS